MGWIACGNKKDLVKTQSCSGLFGNVQVTKMNGIERSAEETNAHGLEGFRG